MFIKWDQSNQRSTKIFPRFESITIFNNSYGRKIQFCITSIESWRFGNFPLGVTKVDLTPLMVRCTVTHCPDYLPGFFSGYSSLHQTAAMADSGSCSTRSTHPGISYLEEFPQSLLEAWNTISIDYRIHSTSKMGENYCKQSHPHSRMVLREVEVHSVDEVEGIPADSISYD